MSPKEVEEKAKLVKIGMEKQEAKYDLMLFSLLCFLLNPVKRTLGELKYFSLTKHQPNDIIFSKDQIEEAKNKIKVSNKGYRNIEELSSLIKIYQQRYSDYDLRFLIHNLKNVNYITIENILYGVLYGGSYNIKKNQLSIPGLPNLFIEDIKKHEFEHFSRALFDKDLNIGLVGFDQFDPINNLTIGTGITEGYTEKIAKRNHDFYPMFCYAYLTQQHLVDLIEFFFDSPIDMEDLYNELDLPGLVKHLQNFAKREDIIKLIKTIDLLSPASAMKPFISSNSMYTDAKLELYRWFMSSFRYSNKSNQFEELIERSPKTYR